MTETKQNSPVWRWHLGALGLYAALAVLVVDHGVNPERFLAGRGSDPFAFVWFMAWMPYALTHHLNPFFTSLLWQPVGVALSWATPVPLLALAGAPVTLLFGPGVSYNLVIIIAPVASAWFAYRLCLALAQDPLAALLGGFLFGFSTYEMAQDFAVLNLSFTCFVPALLWVVVLRLQDKIGRLRAVLLASLCLAAEFLTSIEIFAMIFIFGGIAWLLALSFIPAQRGILVRLFIDGLLAAPIVAIALSPLLWQMFLHRGTVNLPALWPYYFAADPLNVILPGKTSIIPLYITNAAGGAQEQDAYIGLPLLLVLALFARGQWQTPTGRFLVVLFLILLIASFGPLLWIAGHPTNISLPWALFMHLPLLGMALPARFALFVSLITAIIAAIWLSGARTQPSRRRRAALCALACLALLPAFHPWMKVPESKFFAPEEVQAQLGPNPRLLLLPFGISGPSSYWQAENNFGFTQTGGYLGFPPKAMQHFKAIWQMLGSEWGADFPANFVKFCEQTNTQYVVAGPGTPAAMLTVLARLHWPSRQVDDVTIFTVPGVGRG